MKQLSPTFVAALSLILLAGAEPQSIAQSVSVSDVVAFTPNTNGFGNPVFNPAQGRNGLLYGVLGNGSDNNPGTIFDFSAQGATSTIYVAPISAGYGQMTSLSLGTDGSFYGAVEEATVIGTGSYGNLFKVTPGGTFTVLHYFNGGSDGGFPFGAPIEASDGNFYGVTLGGCCLLSTVYKYTPKGEFSAIFTFSSPQGSSANYVIEGFDGDLYVTCGLGGASRNGTIVRLTKGGKLVSIYSFPGGTGGSEPGGLVAASDGNYYGSTLYGGNQNHGTIFRMTPQGAVTVTHTFNSTNGGSYYPGFLIQATDGYLYTVNARGGTFGNGAFIRVSTQGDYSEIYSFPTSVASQPNYNMQATNGLIYGTAVTGGTYDAGAIYSVNERLDPFVAFVVPVGKSGESAQILGQGLTGTNSVTFNGVPATSFDVKSDTFMTAAVPDGATTGKVVVTTPSGKLISNVNFRISK